MQKELEKIRNGHADMMYFVQGTEQYLLQLVKNVAMQHIVPLEDRDMNVSVYHAQEQSVMTAIEDANSMPFLGDRKVVMIEHAQFLTSDKQKQLSDEELDMLMQYIQDPNPDTVLFIFAPYETLDNRKKVVKLLKEKATYLSAQALSESETVHFMQQRIQGNGYSMDRSALQELLERTQYQLSLSVNELDKLFLLNIEHKNISKQDVQQIVAKSLENNVFLLVEYALKKQADKLIEAYRELILQKEEPLKILALFLSQVRLLMQTKLLMIQGYQQSDIAQQLKQHPYRVKLAAQQADRFTVEKLAQLYRVLSQTDFTMKTSGVDKDIQMEVALLQMI